MKTKTTAIQFDEFLHQIQQPKMKELWDNKENEGWKIKRIEIIL